MRDFDLLDEALFVRVSVDVRDGDVKDEPDAFVVRDGLDDELGKRVRDWLDETLAETDGVVVCDDVATGEPDDAAVCDELCDVLGGGDGLADALRERVSTRLDETLAVAESVRVEDGTASGVPESDDA